MEEEYRNLILSIEAIIQDNKLVQIQEIAKRLHQKSDFVYGIITDALKYKRTNAGWISSARREDVYEMLEVSREDVDHALQTLKCLEINEYAEHIPHSDNPSNEPPLSRPKAKNKSLKRRSRSRNRHIPWEDKPSWLERNYHFVLISCLVTTSIFGFYQATKKYDIQKIRILPYASNPENMLFDYKPPKISIRYDPIEVENRRPFHFIFVPVRIPGGKLEGKGDKLRSNDFTQPNIRMSTSLIAMGPLCRSFM